MQGYAAVSHDAVVAHVREALIDNGIVVRQSLIHSKMKTVGKTKYDNDIFMYRAEYMIDFINEDNPQDLFAVTVEAHAIDSGDKGPGKAMSYAKKYALLKTLELETGEDDESRLVVEQESRAITGTELATLQKKIAACESTEAKFIEAFNGACNTEHQYLHEMTLADYKKAVVILNNRYEKIMAEELEKENAKTKARKEKSGASNSAA